MRILPLLLCAAPLLAQPAILLTSAEVKRLAAGRPEPLFSKLKEAAGRALREGPFSVTAARPPVEGPGPNDFYSTGPYWWPDPKNPTGPYIRRDGEVNPKRFTANDRDQGRMADATLALALAAALDGNREAGARAAELIRIWFLDPGTRMNPNLEWGQAIPGVADKGRGIGIIDTIPLIYASQAIALLEQSAGYDARGVKQWFRDYTRWLTTSAKGLDEKKNGNNHSTWWAAQVAAYSALTGDLKLLDEMASFHREYLTPHQLKPDGSAPLEEARTRSLSYSVMNLGGFSVLLRVLALNGRNVTDYRTAEGAGALRSAAYLQPFAADPSLWKKPQITPFDNRRAWFLALLGGPAGRGDWVEFYRRRAVLDSPFALLVEAVLAGQP
jgi:hypothetical protein